MTPTIRPHTRRQVTRTAHYRCGCAAGVTSDPEHVAAELARIRAERCPFHMEQWRAVTERLTHLRRAAHLRIA